MKEVTKKSQFSISSAYLASEYETFKGNRVQMKPK